MEAASKCIVRKLPETDSIPDRSAEAVKRAFDLLCSIAGLLVIAPAFLLIAAVIKLSDGGPVFYRQTRTGLNGMLFSILKFRTMVVNADKVGPSVTRDRDPRITSIGRILRKTKLDELPQLWNVLCGEMSFVGPRPEVPRYVSLYSEKEKQVLNLKPGITDLASLAFRHEEELLKHANDLETFYTRVCVPRKARLNLEYARSATLFSDISLILRTLIPGTIATLAGYGLIMFVGILLSVAFLQPSLPVASVFETAGRFSLVILPVQLACLIWRKLHKASFDVFDLFDVKELTIGLIASCALLTFIAVLTSTSVLPRPELLVANTIVTFSTLLAFRNLRAIADNRKIAENICIPPGRVAAIIGASAVGARIAAQLSRSGVTVRAFFDENPNTWHKCIRGIPVVGMPEALLTEWRKEFSHVVIALPDAPGELNDELVQLVNQAGLTAIIPTWIRKTP